MEISIEEYKSLTERAAALRGITLIWSSDPEMKPRDKATMQVYAPLDDNGQAFDLASSLVMQIQHARPMRPPQALREPGVYDAKGYDRVVVSPHGRGHCEAMVVYGKAFGEERCAAVRLAVVRCAAALYDDMRRD